MEYYQTHDLNQWLEHFHGPLAADEAEHNLIIGIAEQMQLHPPAGSPVLAACLEQGQACLAALKTPGWILLLGACSARAKSAVEPLVQAMVHQQTSLPGVNGRADLADAFAQAWQRETGCQAVLQIAQNVYCLSLAYTPPAFRGKGYGTACLAALSADQLARGKDFCCLYADSDNPTTNKISRQLGYKKIAKSRQYAFEACPSGAP